MSFGWSLIRDSGYLYQKKSSPSPVTVTTGALVYVAGYSSSSYNGAGSTWFDLSGNGNNMTISGATWSAVNKAFSFNGISDYIYTPDIYTQLLAANVAVSQTQEIWFKTSATNGALVQEANAVVGPSWYDTSIEVVSNIVKMRYWNLSSPYVTAGTNDSTKWMYACVRYNGSTLIIDGNFNGTFTSTTAFTREFAPTPATIYYILGQSSATNMGTSTFYSGLIGMYRTYKRALTNAEILANYNAEKSNYGY